MVTDHPWEPLHRRFERWAATDGARPALIDPASSGTPLSYRDLDHEASRLARHLHARGARPGTLVGIAAGRGVSQIAAVLAVLKTGAGYVPLDPSYPRARLDIIVTDCAPQLIVGTGKHRWMTTLPSIRSARTTFVDMDDLGAEPAYDKETESPAPDDTMYVIHTSGSTGRPKGVVVPHRCVTRLFDVTQAPLDIGPTDVWTALHSFAFDFSVWEFWGALAHGGCLVAVPDGTAQDPEELWRLVLEHDVTVLNQTPSAFQRLIAAAERVGFPRTRLRLIVFGGERLSPRSLRPWVEAYGAGHPHLVNMYGITETTVHVTLRELALSDTLRDQSPIGRPLDDLQLSVLDSRLQPVSAGEVGEIYVRGPGVTQGYLGHPGLTAQRFLPALQGPPGGRMYRTGDLARVEPTGDLMFQGRIDRQVKIRGFRVEPGEIEAALLAVPGTRQAAVVLNHNENGDASLTGYVVSSRTPTQIRAALAETLPRHLVPTMIVPMLELPLTPHGKIDNHALPRPRTGNLAITPQARSDPHRLLTEIWAHVLDAPKIDDSDDFFALGGDSIRAAAVVARCHEHGFALGVASLYRHPTIKQLAPTLTRAAPARDRREEDRASHHPASAQQAGILYDCDVTADATLYRVLAAVHLDGPLVPSALRATLSALANRHEALRTDFDLAPDGHRQRVHRDVQIPLSITPATAGMSPAEALMQAWHRDWARRIDPERAPLARCHVLRHPDGTYHLALAVHHAILDGWSLALVAGELITGYRAHLTGQPPPPALPVHSTQEHLERERQVIRDPREQLFWRRRLPALDPGPAPGRMNGAVPDLDACAALPDTTWPRLLSLARDLRVSMKSLFLTAYLWTVGALTRHPTPVIGIVCDVRPETSRADKMVGMYLNLLPMAADLPEHESWQSLIRHTFEQEQEILQHRWMPLAQLSAWRLGPTFHSVVTYTDFRVLREIAVSPLRQLSNWTFVNRTSFPIYTEIHHGPLDDTVTVSVRTTDSPAPRTLTLLSRAISAMVRSPTSPLPDVSERRGGDQ